MKRKKKKRRRGRRRREEEEEEIKQAKVWNFGFFLWKLTLIMDSIGLCMNFHAWLVSSLSLNLGFC